MYFFYLFIVILIVCTQIISGEICIIVWRERCSHCHAFPENITGMLLHNEISLSSFFINVMSILSKLILFIKCKYMKTKIYFDVFNIDFFCDYSSSQSGATFN